MRDYLKFYIDGAWVDPVQPITLSVINPATEEVAGLISLGSATDIDLAVCAARRAFPAYSRTSRSERLELLRRVVAGLEGRIAEMAAAITEEMGAPAYLARNMQAVLGLSHLQVGIAVLEKYEFEKTRGTTLLMKEPIGVCGLITPWNWPLNQIAAKVVPALAVGCTMVLKPSEIAPFSAQIWTEILHDAGVPAGVFNLVNGDGATTGASLSGHPDVDLVSFTGSTRAGVEIARSAATTVKRVCQELGGKSANVILDDADLETAVTANIRGLMMNSGQTCAALTRMIAPATRIGDVVRIAAAAADAIAVGPPESNADMGPLASEAQWIKVQSLIQKGIDEGATLVTGGTGRPEGLERGHYARPTVFSDVTPHMTIAREEIFGPVLSIMPYSTLEEAIELANDTPYGLSGGVWGKDPERLREVVSRLRTGNIMINESGFDPLAPFGGYKQSGNGREGGEFGFEEFLEVKAVMGGEQIAAAAA